MSEIRMRNAVYLFCIARSGLLPAIEGTGPDDLSPLFAHRCGDITAVASLVSLEDFCGPAAESGMQELSWVGPRACRHEEVAEQVMRCSPVLPVRFGTIFSSLESLEKRLQEHRVRISMFLDEVADKEEWAVKGMLDRTKAMEEIRIAMLAGEAECLAPLSPGIRYLHEQRILAGAEKELNGWLMEVCSGIALDLNHYALNFRERRVLSRETTGEDLDMVLNWAFLVHRSNAADFRARINQANADYFSHGLVCVLSGPWPPYSFSPSLETEQST